MNTKRTYQFGARSATAAHPPNQQLNCNHLCGQSVRNDCLIIYLKLCAKQRIIDI